MVDRAALRSHFPQVTDVEWDLLGTYFERLIEWNKKLNLTAITDELDVFVKHFYDSLLVMGDEKSKEIFQRAEHIADIGTGAGFPGMVLAMMAPEKRFVLVDSLAKRLRFLETVAKELGLRNVELIHGRAEDVGRQAGCRQAFDLVLSRAVARLNVLCELSLPMVKVGGWFISYKGPSAAEELEEAERAVRVLGAEGKFVSTQFLPYDMGTRALVGIKKLRETSKQYPRKAGTPQKSPL